MTAPDITSINPSSGPGSGGTNVVIFGSGLSSATQVFFGSLAAAQITSITDSMITVLSPRGESIGNVDLTVVTPNGNQAWKSGFNYLFSVDSVYPASGALRGGLQVTISGSGMLQVGAVTFGNSTSQDVIDQSDTKLIVTAPPSVTPGSVDVGLLDEYGNNIFTKPNGFTYLAATVDGSTSPAPAAPNPATPDPGAAAGASKAASPKPADPAAAADAKPVAPDPSAAKPAAAASTTPDAGAPKPPAPATGAAAGSSTVPPPSGDYIPGGRMIVPGGQTGLGGSAGTGAGFGVGTLMAGGGGSAAPSNLPYYVDPALTAQLVQTLIGLVQNATSPDALEAQNIILRRIALEGDVIGLTDSSAAEHLRGRRLLESARRAQRELHARTGSRRHTWCRRTH